MKKPRIPVVSNVDATPHDDPEEIRALLVQQVVSPVRWEDSVRYLLAQGCGQFYEVGPGRVLRGSAETNRSQDALRRRTRITLPRRISSAPLTIELLTTEEESVMARPEAPTGETLRRPERPDGARHRRLAQASAVRSPWPSARPARTWPASLATPISSRKRSMP